MQSTEATYVEALQSMVDDYLTPLMNAAETDLMPNVFKEDIRSIFANTEHLLPINKALYDQICERVASWSPKQCMGDIFLKMAPFFKIYNTYQNNYERAQDVLSRLQLDHSFKEECDRIAKSVQQRTGDTKAASLEGLLIQPVQRIPRYIMLLGELLRKTDESHVDFPALEKSITELEQVMTKLDMEITAHEFREKFLSMGSKIKGATNLIKAHRFLISEGTVNLKTKTAEQAKSSGFAKTFKKEAKLQIWLFNDVMVHLKSTKSKRRTNVSSTKYTWPLELVWIQDNPEPDPLDPKMPHSFLLVGPRKTYHVRFADEAEKREWMGKISSTVKKVLNEENAPDDVHRHGSYVFPDKQGGEYDGWWKFGRIHGQGTFKIYGNTYTGEWEYNRKCGQGTFESVTTDVYHGTWKDDRPNGYGQLLYANQDRYDGFWVDGMRHGKGVLYYAGGAKFDGEWDKDVPHGEGCYTTPTGWLYNGGWSGGRLHGQGVLISPNGRRFEGEFRSGMKWGEGKLDYGNGDFYIGQWAGDKRHGFGVLHSAVDGVYEGMFVNGLKEGHGKQLFVNGDIYEGGWKRDVFHDKGVLICACGGIDRYDGSFEHGKFNGKGTLYYRNGTRYDGQFKDDKPHGTGLTIAANGVVYEGKWIEGRRDGKATLSVGPAKFSATCHNSMMGRDEASFFVTPDAPGVHIEI